MKLKYARPMLAALSLTYAFVLQLLQGSCPIEMWGLATLSFGWFSLDRTLTHRLGDKDVAAQ